MNYVRAISRTVLRASIEILACAGILFPYFAPAQEVYSDRIQGLRVTGGVQAGVPVVVQGKSAITVEFDTNEDHPADFKVKYYHCDKNWKKTATSFINDDVRNTTRSPLSYVQSPVGTEYYRWHYSVQLPGHQDVQRFLYSGNYIFEIWDENGRALLARGRFFVVEGTIAPIMRVMNRQEPSFDAPLYMVHRVDVQFGIPEMIERQGTDGFPHGSQAEEQEVIIPLFFTTVDVYKNRELYRNYRIDANERKTSTFVEGFGTRRMRFSVDNIQPGNEYRRLDLRNVDYYPPGRISRIRGGADVSRMLFRAPRDNSGLSTLVGGDRYADYVRVQFEYLDESLGEEDTVYVVGDLNGWRTDQSSLMSYDVELKRFLFTISLRRGEYDYQYVRKNDWVALEGNDWRTVNVYSAFVYYRDERFGGFDRIVGFVQGSSSGQNTATDF